MKARTQFLLAPLLVLATLIGALFFLNEPTERDVPRDDDLCPVDSDLVGDVVAFLFDFRKPLDAALTNLPGNLLRDLTLDSKRDTEFRVYFLTGAASAPRALLKRLCKPYANDDLQVKQAKDQNGAVRDCDDLPAQLAEDVRRSAVRFCASRQALQQRLGALATNASHEDRIVTDAYLVEAFEHIRMEISEGSGPNHLHVFSDMMQHADWYSHLDIEWTSWDYEEFAELHNARSPLYATRRGRSDMQVHIHYLPRSGKTDQPRLKELHRQFWRDYFANTRVSFHDQPPVRAYPSEPMMNLLTEAELAAQERAAMEQLLIELENEQQALEQTQRELHAQRQNLGETGRQRQLSPQRQALAERRFENARPPQVESGPGLATVEEPEPETELRFESVQSRRTETDGQSDTGQRRPLETEHQSDARQRDRTEIEQPLEIAQQRHAETDQQPATEILSIADVERPVTEPVMPTQQEQHLLPQRQTAPLALASPPPLPTQSIEVEAPLCDLLLPTDFEEMRPEYPNRGGANYGDAIITVQYVIDELGETEDEEVAVVAERSNAERTRYYNRFARAATSQVRDWTFSFAELNDQDCTKRRTAMTSFHFRYD